MGPGGMETFDLDKLPAGFEGKGTKLGLNGKAEVFVATGREAQVLDSTYLKSRPSGHILAGQPLNPLHCESHDACHHSMQHLLHAKQADGVGLLHRNCMILTVMAALNTSLCIGMYCMIGNAGWLNLRQHCCQRLAPIHHAADEAW